MSYCSFSRTSMSTCEAADPGTAVHSASVPGRASRRPEAKSCLRGRVRQYRASRRARVGQ
eukprot:2354444-Rhodomonas_salina.1